MQNRTNSEASGSAPPASSVGPLHTAWQPYRLLAPSTRKRIDPTSTLTEESFLKSLNIPANVASERLASKYLQLEPPKGKMTEKRKIELEKKAEAKEMRKVKRVKEGECGLIGRRKRASLSKKGLETTVRYEAVLPIHSLWLGYMAEVLSLSLVIPTTFSPVASTSTLPISSTSTTASLIPTFPTKNPTDEDLGIARELNISVANLHSKLVKAEFVGCILTVKRAKNPSLVNLTGLVLQETQGTFKIVTTASKIKVLAKKGSIFTFLLPLTVSSAAKNSNVTKRELSFDIYGDAFCFRSAERVGRKWKAGGGEGGVNLI